MRNIDKNYTLCDNVKESAVKNVKDLGTDYSFKHEIVWKNAIGFLILHLLGVWGWYIAFTGGVSWKTFVWTVFFMYVSCHGTTVGAHRYFTHKTFKATPLLRAILLTMQTIAGQNCMYIWCRDHRLHHRYSDTDADPHNSKRGFFFSHVGWLMARKHPYVKQFGKTIDMSDLESDWMVMLQMKYYYVLYILLSILLPVMVPVYLFGERFWPAFMVCYLGRYVFELNATWLVNSAAHIYGTRPYDRNLKPVESWFVSFLTNGEGWHNYHHTFPWDYKAAELGTHFNNSAKLIRLFERMGLAYDLKTASTEVVEKRILRTGDGTHHRLGAEGARAAVTAFGPLHPFNPTYTTLEEPTPTLTSEGLPLFEQDLFNLDSVKRVVTF